MEKNAGFSFIELVIVIAIVGILSSLAAPRLLQWRTSTKLRGEVSTFYGNLKKAKSRAIRDNADVTVTFPSSNSYTISGAGIGSSNYDMDGEVAFTTSSTITFNSRGLTGATANIDFNDKKRIRINRFGVMNIQTSYDGGTTWN